MSFLVDGFNLLLYQPLLNILVLLYEYIPGHDFGIAVIILTLLIRFLFYPLGIKAIKSQKALSEIQPKVKEVQEQYKDDKEKQAKEIMALYKRENINPFSSFLPLLIQLPVLIALYRVFWHGFQAEQMVNLYSFMPLPGQINTFFLGILDLAAPSLFLAVLAGISQFIQVKMTIPKFKKKKGKQSDFSQIMQKQMQYFFPIFTVIILLRLPAAIGVYWLTTTLFTIIQQYFILKKQKDNPQHV